MYSTVKEKLGASVNAFVEFSIATFSISAAATNTHTHTLTHTRTGSYRKAQKLQMHQPLRQPTAKVQNISSSQRPSTIFELPFAGQVRGYTVSDLLLSLIQG